MTLQYNSARDTDYIDLRDRLYYNTYTYRATVCVPRGSWWRPNSSQNEWVSEMRDLAFSRKSQSILAATPDLYDRWWSWCNALPEQSRPQLRSEGRKTAVYSNDLQLLKSLSAVDPHNLIITRAVAATKTAGVRYYRTKPKHKYRIYLRSGRVSRTEYTKFLAFIRAHSERLHVSPGLRRNMRHDYDSGLFPHTWVSSSFFLDYDDPKVECWLQLSWGELLGKHYELRQWENPEDAA